jgi:regulator of replication initiation timing
MTSQFAWTPKEEISGWPSLGAKAEKMTGNMSGRRVLLILLTIVCSSAGLFLIIFLKGDAIFQADLLKKVSSTLLQLVLLGTLGAYAKYLLDQHSANRQRQLAEADRERKLREDKHTFQIRALNSLTTNYWQIKKALFIICANQSAKSYKEQMHQIIDYRLELQKLNNEIEADPSGLEDTKIINSLKEMDGQLDAVIEEWRERNLELSQLQNRDEKIEEIEKKRVPKEMASLPKLKEISDNRFELIHVPFQIAATAIREQLVVDQTAHGSKPVK